MTSPHGRRGSALVLLLVILGVVSLLVVAIVWQTAVTRRTLERQEDRVQATWLARAGVEIAAAKLLADPKYDGETVEVIPDGPVQITVRREKDVIHVTSEARYSTDGPPVVRSLDARYRLTGEGDQARLDNLSASRVDNK